MKINCLKQSMRTESSSLDQQSKAWSEIVSQVYHAMATKMATLQMKQKVQQEVFPILLRHYYLSIEQNLASGEIKTKYLDAMDNIVNLEEQIAPMMELFHSLHIYCNQLRSDSDAIRLLSASACVNELLDQYPFESEPTRSLVHIDDSHDFQFKCSPIFIRSLLENLLDNALVSIDKAGKGDINIWFSQEGDFYCLHFKDTGLGMDERASSIIFDRFLTARRSETVPGLGFCRLAIMQAGGDVICYTEKEKYSHFIMMFPMGL